MTDFEKKIKTLMLNANIQSYRQLAKLCGYKSAKNISGWVNQRHEPGRLQKATLATALGVQPSEIWEGEK